MTILSIENTSQDGLICIEVTLLQKKRRMMI